MHMLRCSRTVKSVLLKVCPIVSIVMFSSPIVGPVLALSCVSFVLSIEIRIKALLVEILQFKYPTARGMPFAGVVALPDMDWG